MNAFTPVPPEIVSILIPCRNEEAFIGSCLQSVVGFSLPENIVTEILVLDGASSDRTAAIVGTLQEGDRRIRLLSNPGLIQSTAMNIGLEQARGSWIMRLDAHSRYPQDYLERCLAAARQTEAQNVGGVFLTETRGDTLSAHLVQALTTHRFGVGNSQFRIQAPAGWADTVPYGFYRRDLFERIGKFDERLVRAQDYEFNRRILASGGKIWRDPSIEIHYYNQGSLSAFYGKQFFREAPYNAYLWYLAPYAFAWRHAMTAFFAAGVIGGLLLCPFGHGLGAAFLGVMALYAGLALVASVQQARRYRRVSHAFLLPPCFFWYHFSHGVGVLLGLGHLVFGAAPVQRRAEPWPGAGRRRAWPQAAQPEH
ncbi:MAG TPA: glycosyltransferase family 2 protein [Opitutaceae bacterium]|nr:glycosyltransferase family 2 protein [Opitutaceae bacterium]